MPLAGHPQGMSCLFSAVLITQLERPLLLRVVRYLPQACQSA